MTGGGGGSYVLRSGSNGSLQQHLHTTLLPNHNPPSSFINRRPLKMLKEKERFFHWMLKFAGRKKVGMVFLCSVSAAVFLWVLYVGKGEDTRDGEQIQRVSSLGDNPSFSFPEFSSIYMKEDHTKYNTSFLIHVLKGDEVKMVTKSFKSPSPPVVFLGYRLPQGHPCVLFTLPPPPTDKKRTGPRPCPVCYLSVEEAVALMPKYPSPSPILHNLTYIYQQELSQSEFGGSEFGGYPSLKERNESFDIRESMAVHCGFVRGIRPGLHTGFNIDNDDLGEMAQCHGVVVASAIFGNYDIIQQPKNMSDAAKQNVCFYMFVDIETETYLRSYGILGGNKMIGLWRIVVIHNLPYADARRNGKVPKLLLHRIFPNARYSLWIDGKLELVVDPYQILERFLWRKNTSFAISRHYRRFDVFQEAEANKAAGKYDNSSIDFQIDFYKREGLTPYSDSKLPIASDVPEGCVIVREHIPITNLFTCLWFNEVDRFTSRDQLSFSTVRDKIMTKLDWKINMFLDCERRNFVLQAYHRDVLEHMPAPRTRQLSPSLPSSPLAVVMKAEKGGAGRKVQPKRGKERRKHRKVISGGTKTII